MNKQQYSDISQRVSNQRVMLEKLQNDIQKDPLNNHLLEEERAVAFYLMFLLRSKESFYKQKSRIQWLQLGDSNTKYFHNSIKQRRVRSSIPLLKLDLGTRVSEEESSLLMRSISEEEVKSTVFSIGSDKAAGPDGYNSFFFKNSWNTIKNDMIKVVQETFNSVLTARLSPILINLISMNQSDFIPKRSIAYNILLAHDIARNYHKNSGNRRCLMKIDLRKAHDSIEWDFIEEILISFNFPENFITLIMTYIKTANFYIQFNGSNGTTFKAEKGLRQGDPSKN
ncbi:uncharacterized protein LOC126681613 [Mercurialis annua]|uniref:uncharacterized protein LOC126681613 n=1 Tax=Mercurialis annua TaxID=3986 RepID=UPI00215DEE73|nr:uncharacterized protein LOC126681613 [Mercurialis annua]